MRCAIARPSRRSRPSGRGAAGGSIPRAADSQPWPSCGRRGRCRAGSRRTRPRTRTARRARGDGAPSGGSRAAGLRGSGACRSMRSASGAASNRRRGEVLTALNLYRVVAREGYRNSRALVAIRAGGLRKIGPERSTTHRRLLALATYADTTPGRAWSVRDDVEAWRVSRRATVVETLVVLTTAVGRASVGDHSSEPSMWKRRTTPGHDPGGARSATLLRSCLAVECRRESNPDDGADVRSHVVSVAKGSSPRRVCRMWTCGRPEVPRCGVRVESSVDHSSMK